MNAYEVRYRDAEDNIRVWATYGYNAQSVTDSAFELLQPGFTIISVMKVPPFDW